jgi:anti-sigma B factor antagonist
MPHTSSGYGRTDLLTDVVDEGPRASRLALVGQLDLTNVHKFYEEIDRLEARRIDRLLIDISELAYIDSTGLAVFLRITERMRADGTELRFTHGPEFIERVLHVSGLDKILPFET